MCWAINPLVMIYHGSIKVLLSQFNSCLLNAIVRSNCMLVSNCNTLLVIVKLSLTVIFGCILIMQKMFVIKTSYSSIYLES